MREILHSYGLSVNVGLTGASVRAVNVTGDGLQVWRHGGWTQAKLTGMFPNVQLKYFHVERLESASTEFRTWWAEHDVARFETRIRRFDHPRAGRLTFEYQQLTPDEWPALRVIVHLPLPGVWKASVVGH